MSDSEELLRGGNATPVARAGDTVLRQAGAWTDSVQALLRHVRSRGVLWVPEPRGRDASGREVLAYIDGTVPSYPLPHWVWEDRLLTDAARRLRQYHDATVDFARTGRTWRLASHAPDEVICHNDFAPHNFVFRDRLLSGVIDFDTASPGPRAWDVAYLAHRLVPLSADADTASDRPRAMRLQRLCASYGDDVTATRVLAMVPARLHELAAFTAAHADDGGYSALREHVAIYRADAAYVRTRHASLLEPPHDTLDTQREAASRERSR